MENDRWDFLVPFRGMLNSKHMPIRVMILKIFAVIAGSPLMEMDCSRGHKRIFFFLSKFLKSSNVLLQVLVAINEITNNIRFVVETAQRITQTKSL